MSAALIAFLFSVGASTWVFTKLQNKTGYGNNKSAFTGAAVVFVIAFILLFTLSHMLLHN
jgi:hypothetical protein